MTLYGLGEGEHSIVPTELTKTIRRACRNCAKAMYMCQHLRPPNTCKMFTDTNLKVSLSLRTTSQRLRARKASLAELQALHSDNHVRLYGRSSQRKVGSDKKGIVPVSEQTYSECPMLCLLTLTRTMCLTRTMSFPQFFLLCLSLQIQHAPSSR